MNTLDSPSVLAAIAEIPGWLSDEQARRLLAAASAADGGCIVEIGSFQGRSTIVLALGAPNAQIVAIDPHAGNDRGPQEIEGFQDAAAGDHERFHDHLRAAGVEDRVRHVRRASGEALGEVEQPIDVLYIDGAPRFAPARDDVVHWSRKVRVGGTVLVHDAFSSIGVTAALLSSAAVGSRLRYAGRTASLVEYRVAALSPSERVTNLGRHLAQLPWFVRNVVIKLAIVAKLPVIARALGHDGETWPY